MRSVAGTLIMVVVGCVAVAYFVGGGLLGTVLTALVLFVGFKAGVHVRRNRREGG